MKRGIFALLCSQILIKITGLAYKLYLTNKPGFGDTGNAIYSSGFQVYALLLTFSSIGVPNAISKIISERLAVGDTKGSHRIFKIAFWTFAMIGLFGTIVLFLGAKIIAAKWIQIPESQYCLIALSPSIFFVSIISVFRGYFNAREKLELTAKSQILEQICKTVFTIILVEIVAKVSFNNVIIMAAVANFATTLATVISFFYVYRYYQINKREIANEISTSINYIPTRVRKTLKKILKESIPISLSSLISSFNKNIDLFTVVRGLKTFMSEKQAIIQYGILSGKIDTICLLPLSLNVPFITAMIPNISKLNALGKKKETEEIIIKYLKISVIIGVGSTICLILFSSLILKILFPNASQGASLLQLNSISIMFAIIAQTLNGILQSIGKSNVPAISFLVGMSLKFIFNITLIKIPNIGIKAAAIGNIICNITVCLIGIVVLKRCNKFSFFKKNKKNFYKKRGILSKIGE